MFNANQFEHDKAKREARAIKRIDRLAARCVDGDRRAIRGVIEAHVALGFGEDEARAFFDHLARPRASVTEQRRLYEALVASHEDPEARQFVASFTLIEFGRLCATRARLLERLEAGEEGLRANLVEILRLGGPAVLRAEVAKMRAQVRAKGLSPGERRVAVASIEAVVRPVLERAKAEEKAARRKAR